MCLHWINELWNGRAAAIDLVGNDILRVAEGKAVEYWGVSAPTG